MLAPLDISTRYGYGYGVPSIETLLFERNDPAMAHARLKEIGQSQPDLWSQHEAMVLKALVLEYNGQFAEASQLLNLVANASQTTDWSRFVQQRR